MKKLVLATLSAAVMATGSAQAADLGKPAPAAVDYVKVCDAYGEGFFYIPGTETCLKVGGYVRAEYRYYGGDKRFWDIYDPSKGPRRTGDSIGSRARADISFDARTNTEFGLLRSFSEIYWTVDSKSNGSVSTTLQKAFIQFGGLTAGRSQSFFDFYLGDHYSSYFETAHSDSIVNLLAYTFSFGNGISATLSLEDPTTGIANRRFESFGPVNGGLKSPDIVGNVNITQGWGSAQVMAAAHRNYSSGLGVLSNSDKWGYAVGAGVTVNLPMLGAGDVFSLQGVWSKGAVSYATPDPMYASDFLPLGGKFNRQTEAWSVATGLTHNWNPSWATSLTGSYLSVDHNIPSNLIPTYKQIDAGVNLVWNSGNGLTIGGELEYKTVDFKSKFINDVDAFVALVRIERKF